MNSNDFPKFPATGPQLGNLASTLSSKLRASIRGSKACEVESLRVCHGGLRPFRSRAETSCGGAKRFGCSDSELNQLITADRKPIGSLHNITPVAIALLPLYIAFLIRL